MVVQCGAIASYVPGNVANPNWFDVTDYIDVEGLDKLTLTYDAISSNDSTSNETGSNYDKGISANLVFRFDAFNYIYNYLLADTCGILRSIDVLLVDNICKRKYRIFELKTDNISYSPFDDPCLIEVPLREQDLAFHCIHKTFIWDDWQKWFNQNGDSAKQHPTFLTCIERRPRIVASVRMGIHYFLRALRLSTLILNFLYDENKETARKILGINKFQPSPLIRDIIDNVTGKCGLAADTMFHDSTSPYYNLCLFHASNGFFIEDDSGVNTNTKYIFDNRFNITLPELADFLKPVFGAEWYLTPNNTFTFYPKGAANGNSVLIDFTSGAYSIENLKYNFAGTKKPAYGKYEYLPDAVDMASQEVRNLYNDVVDYDGPSNNPMLEGSITKTIQFAPTGFVRDGRAEDYIQNLVVDGFITANVLIAMLVLITASLVAGVLSAGGAIIVGAAVAIMEIFFVSTLIEYNSSFSNNPLYHGAVRLTNDQTSLPRLLLWDGVSKEIAKVVRTSAPTVNTYYNPTNKQYGQLNDISKDNPSGYIYNFPMYFDSNFTGNLFDRFRDIIDNPLKSLDTNQTFSLDTDLCCDILELLGVFENDFTKIGYLVKIERRLNYSVYGEIENISVNYSSNTVTLKGKVVKL